MTFLEGFLVLTVIVLAVNHLITWRRVRRLEADLTATRLMLDLHVAGYPVRVDVMRLRTNPEEE